MSEKSVEQQLIEAHEAAAKVLEGTNQKLLEHFGPLVEKESDDEKALAIMQRMPESMARFHIYRYILRRRQRLPL